MKKYLIVSLLIVSLALTGCEKKESKALIIDNDGNKVEMTYKELKELNEKNNPKFQKNYEGASIEFTDKISSIGKPISCGNIRGECIPVEFENGWIIQLLKNNENKEILELNKHLLIEYNNAYDLTNFDIGDTILVRSKIQEKLIISDIEYKSGNYGSEAYFDDPTEARMKAMKNYNRWTELSEITKK